MSEMIERVKRALLECKPGESMARAAIGTMREPTDEMTLASGIFSLDAADVWRAMVDEALKS